VIITRHIMGLQDVIAVAINLVKLFPYHNQWV